MDQQELLRIFAFVLFGGWLFTGLRVLRTMHSIHHLPRAGIPSGEADDRRPVLSVIIPFRNEVRSLEATVEPFLAQDLPIEIILIDDGSTDGSGDIADRLAADARVSVLRPGEPPPDWLGKPWACHHGGLAAQGAFLLFMDADVRVAPTLLPDLLRFLQRERPPHLVIFPFVRAHSLLEASYMTLFMFLFLFRFDPHAAARRGGSGHVGVGAFNLVRRDIYEAFGGYASLRLAVADDVMLGRRVKQAGGYTRTLHAGDRVQVRWREGFRDTLRGTRRSIFAGTGFSSGWLLLAIVGTFGGILAPFVLLTFGDPLIRIPAAGAAALSMILPALLRRGRHRVVGGLLFPVQSVVFLGIYIASAADVLLGRPLQWRGRSYDLGTLRSWQRSHH